MKGSAKVQIGAELLCKSGRGGAARGHVGKVTWGQALARGDMLARWHAAKQRQKDSVTGDGHGHREFRRRPFGHRELAPGFRRPRAERPTPERLMPWWPSPVTLASGISG